MSRLPRNLLAVYAAHGLNGVVSVAAIPITVRLLGLPGYGLLSIYVLMVSHLLLADFGIGKNLLRLLAESRDPEAKRRKIQVALGLYVVLVAAWLAAIPLLKWLVPRYVFPVSQPYLAALRWIVVLSIAEFALGIPASVMQTACVAEQRFDRYSAYTLVSGLVRNGALILSAVVFRSPAAVAAVLAGRKVVDFAIAGRVLGLLPRQAWMPLFDLQEFRHMLRQSLTLSAAQVLNSSLMSAGSILVNAGFGLFGLGTYRAAYDLAGKIAFVSNGVTLVTFPKAARYFGIRSLEGEGALFAPIMRASTALFMCFAAVMVVASPYLLPAMGLKNDFTARLFVLLVVALSLNAHSLLSNELIQASGRYVYSICFSGSALVVLGILFAVIRTEAGVMAIGWAWIGAAVVSALLSDALLLRLCHARTSTQFAIAILKLMAIAGCLCLVWPQIHRGAGAAWNFAGVALLTFVVAGAAPGAFALLCGRYITGPAGEAVRPVPGAAGRSFHLRNVLEYVAPTRASRMPRPVPGDGGSR